MVHGRRGYPLTRALPPAAMSTTEAPTAPADESASAAPRGMTLPDLMAQADAFMAEGRLGGAVALYKLALRAFPQVIGLHFNLALALLRYEHPQEAIHHFDVLLTAQNQPAWLQQRARQGLAVALEQSGNTAAAAAEYRRLLQSEPDNFAVLRQLGTLYRDLGLHERALEAYAHCHRLWPAHAGIAVELAQLRLMQADWSAAPDAAATSALAAACQQLPAGVEPPPPHVFLQLPGDLPLTTLAELAHGHSRHIEQACGLPAGGALAPLHRTREGRRLHLAYAVSDVHLSSTAWLQELLQAHDRDHYQISLYTWSPDDDSAARESIEGLAEHTIDVHGWSDAAIAARLREDRVDVLLDPGSPARHSRPAIFARRPAPLQLAWLADPVCAFSGWFDALLSDAVQLGDDPAPWPCPVLTLPGCARTLRHHTDELDTGPRLTRRTQGLPLRAPVLACFAEASALSPALFSLWLRQIAPVRNAVLWLANHPRPLRERLVTLAEAQGLPRQRLRFLDDTLAHRRTACLRLADLVLDTGRAEGGGPIHDALSAGVPVLSWAGRHSLQRIGQSLLAGAGDNGSVDGNNHQDPWVAPDLAAYEARLHHLLRHPRELMACREHLQRHIQHATTALPLPPAHNAGALATALQARIDALWAPIESLQQH